jgi:thioredoxin 1
VFTWTLVSAPPREHLARVAMTLFSKMCEEVDGIDAELDAAVRFPRASPRGRASRLSRRSRRFRHATRAHHSPFVPRLPSHAQAAATSTSAIERRDRAAAALARLEEASSQVEKMRQKAAERDPEKRIYNETMTSKVLALADKLAATREKAADVRRRIQPLVEEEEKEAAEVEAAEARAKAEAERLAAESEAAAKAAFEAEARAAEEAAAAAKREAEREAARVKAEREAAKAKADEETAAAAAAADAARAAEAKAAEEAAEAEKLRKAEEAKAKKAALAARVAAAAPAGSDPVPPPAAGASVPVTTATTATTATTETTHAETPSVTSGPAAPSTAVEANAAALAAMLASMAPPSAPPASAPTPASGETAKTYGEVRHVLGGAAELRGALEGASAAGALTVVDWSIPTCGPCQRIRPAFERMARERVSVLFVGVDAAASAENRALAQSAAVRAYPTFHFYVGMRRVAELTGADESRIASLVDRHAPPARLSRAALDMQAAISAALMTLRSSCGSLHEFVAATRTLLVFVGNVVTHPGEAKYRRVRLANAAFQSKLGRFAGGVAAMEAFGFVKEGLGEDASLVMSETNARHEGLPAMRRLLEQALPSTG